MTTRLVTPWWIDRAAVTPFTSASGGTDPTRSLDWHSPAIGALIASLREDGQRQMLVDAHALISGRVRPVYAVNDAQPASRTLRRRRGSCSQRFAVLEAVARAIGVATRVQGLLVEGSFWYPRFPHLQFLVPDVVVLAWPEFWLEGQWVRVSSLFNATRQPSEPPTATQFTNAGAETLFDAVRRTSISWDPAAAASCGPWSCDLSAAVQRDLGYFDSRDDLFDRVGQTLHRVACAIADPVVGRWERSPHLRLLPIPPRDVRSGGR